ncbi:AAA family ATPase [Clostridium sp.]|uniref:AAA family ATPase n=1 Tax=Clostridium sp. TaxID=1506 RepID=UPI002900949D|nr:AAA family ATPase [Clostridium sp.]MDU1968986.1 AAA family ATPase [Clostridium perfringens]MDU1823976.1 AAA family ATPase [Clostridium sp.]MDU1841031.1 AAA family ATPase [Clostridium sp.]MDU2691410.1 AAA family ATPase [Clostridium sp.]MDU2957269.1 AAA family ATPase [Clostridium sp.]
MKLKWVHLKNFRGYKDITVNFDENMNVIIGKNDIGKSTIMEALEIFFNGSNNPQIKIDVDDLNIYSDDDKEIEISCGFSDCSDEIIIDSATKTTLNREYLLNKEGLLEVKKVWNCSKEKITASDLKIYINANYPKITDKPLVNMKISELKKILESIKEQIESYDDIKKSVSSEIRMSIYNYYIHNECEFEETLIDISKEDAKDIWSKINLFLPVFFLFRSDRSNVDSDSEVQNPLKIATKNALKEIEYELNAIKKKVEEAVKVIGDNTINKLKEMNEEIAANLETELNTKAWDSIFSFELIDGKGIPLNKRGSGVRRLMLLSYFRAEAERVMSESCKNDIIYAIEEPETSQHPNYQRMIMETFIDISNDPNHQIILTTHTPEIAKMVNPEQLVFIKRNDKGFSEIVKDEEDKINGIIDSLGILPNITSKLIICVEGETDVMFLENISKLKCFADIIDLDENNISILPMKGGNLKSWIGKNCLDGSNVKEMHLYDSDIQEYVNLINDMNNKPDGRRWGISTKRLEIENYIPPHLIEERLKIEIEKEIKDNWHKIDVPKLLMSKYGQKRNIEEKQIKCILNGSIAKQITKESLEEINAYEEICEWFRKIKEINNV